MARMPSIIVLAAALVGVGGIVAGGLFMASANRATGPFAQAYEACTRVLERPSTIETELTLQSALEADLKAQGWRIVNPNFAADIEAAMGLYGVSSELIRVAVEGTSYGAQYNGAEPHEYWSVVQGYLPPSAYETVASADANIRNKWLISGDRTALVVFGARAMTSCTLNIGDDGFDRSVLADVPVQQLGQLGDFEYEYHRNSDAEFDGGISQAALIYGAQFQDVLQTDVPSVWDITIHRPSE